MSRRWLVLAVRPPDNDEQAEALVVECLIELGGRAVWEEAGRLVTHVAEPDDPIAFLAHAEDRLREVGGADLELESDWQAHEDWAEIWKRGLAPRRLTPRLIVTPSWETPELQPGDIVITLDPGMAFGNAEHGTTRGCLRLMDDTVSAGDRVLDIGTGSGILAIAAVHLGAREVVGLDGDPLACEASRENLVRNHAMERVTIQESWATVASLEGLGVFDGLVANIESGILRPLLPGIRAAVRPGGWVILSGILGEELDSVLQDAESHDLVRPSVDADGEWRSVLLRRRG